MRMHLGLPENRVSHREFYLENNLAIWEMKWSYLLSSAQQEEIIPSLQGDLEFRHNRDFKHFFDVKKISLYSISEGGGQIVNPGIISELGPSLFLMTLLGS